MVKYTIRIQMVSGSEIIEKYDTKEAADSTIAKIFNVNEDGCQWAVFNKPRRLIRLSNIECVTMEID